MNKPIPPKVLALALVVTAAAAAWLWWPRERSGFGWDAPNLLSQRSVQAELGLTPEQAGRLAELGAGWRNAWRDLRRLDREERQQRLEEQARANEKAVRALLLPEQLARLRQIYLQQRGLQALADDDVARALELTSRQKETIRALEEGTRHGARALFRGGNPDEVANGPAGVRLLNDDQLQEVLTLPQRERWKALLGEPFQGEVPRPPVFGDGGRRGRRNQNFIMF